MLTVHSLNDGLLSVRLQLGYVDARGVGEGAAEAQNRLEALFSIDRDIHSGSDGKKLGKFQRCHFHISSDITVPLFPTSQRGCSKLKCSRLESLAV